MANTRKALLFLRTSTETQELENQKKEMQDYVKNMGYNEGDCVLLEKSGASAIKLDDDYMLMVNQLIEYIDSGEISCVALWSVDRVLRDEEIWPKIKKKLVAKKIQLVIKNPSLALLNPDGSINEGSELALSLFSTMAAQEMRIKQERFKRTKRAYAKQGKWPGGRTKKFGYKVDENRFFVEDENDGAIVKLVYQLYSTGEYSAESLAKELNDRGIKRNDGVPINYRFVVKLLKCNSYTGAPDEKNNMRVYPAIITKELYDKCRKIAESNKLVMRTGERIVPGAKLLKCHICGGTYTSNSRHFGCCRNMHKDCTNNLKIRQCVVDNILWRISYTLHLDYLMDLNEETTGKYLEQIEVIEQKITTYMDKIKRTADLKQRAIDSFLDGLIDKKKRDSQLSKIEADAQGYRNEINTLTEQKAAIEGLIDNIDTDLNELNLLNAMDIVEIAEQDKQSKYNIIHKHILKVVPSRMSFGIRDPRTTRDNGVLFTIYTVNGAEMKYLFIPKFYKGHNLYIWNDSTQEWVADMVEITDNIYVKKEAN